MLSFLVDKICQTLVTPSVAAGVQGVRLLKQLCCLTMLQPSTLELLYVEWHATVCKLRSFFYQKIEKRQTLQTHRYLLKACRNLLRSIEVEARAAVTVRDLKETEKLQVKVITEPKSNQTEPPKALTSAAV